MLSVVSLWAVSEHMVQSVEKSMQFYPLDKAELATECNPNEYVRGKQNHI